MQIDQDSLNIKAEEISHQLHVLSELVQESPAAYKLCYEISQHFIKFSEHASILAAYNKQMPLNLEY